MNDIGSFGLSGTAIIVAMVVAYIAFTAWLTARMRSKTASEFMVGARSMSAVVVGVFAGWQPMRWVNDLGADYVSARLNQESARDIPFGLSVLDEHTLQTRRLRTLEDALRGTPGVDVNSWGGANDANVRIRGVGSLNQMSMDDGSVVLNVDGVERKLQPSGPSLPAQRLTRQNGISGPLPPSPL